jgi:hypothetical protein
MPCSRSEATLRLIAAYCSRAVDGGEAFTAQFRLADYLEPQIISAVAEEDLLREFSDEVRQEKIRRINAELDRRQRQMLKAWQASRSRLSVVHRSHRLRPRHHRLVRRQRDRGDLPAVA